jgi:hypothetical protein
MNIKDYLHLYLGCKYRWKNDDGEWSEWIFLTAYQLNYIRTSYCMFIQLRLRKLSDMTEEEANYFAWLCLDSKHHLEEDSRVSQDEIQIELAKDDGGNMLDADVEICITVNCRCFDGFVVIKKDGSMSILEEDGEITKDPIEDVADKVRWLLSKHFDLFGLIEAGLAIDKNKPQ